MNTKKLVALGVLATPVLLIWATEGVFSTLMGVACMLPCALGAWILWQTANL